MLSLKKLQITNQYEFYEFVCVIHLLFFTIQIRKFVQIRDLFLVIHSLHSS